MPNTSPCILEEHLSIAEEKLNSFKPQPEEHFQVAPDNKGVQQHTLLNLGADFALPREHWPELTNRVEGILVGQQSLFGNGGDIEQLDQSCTSWIIASYRDVEP